jgi:hypothetical protein
VFRARLARGEREQAIDWFLAHGRTLQRPAGGRDGDMDGEGAPRTRRGKQPTRRRRHPTSA